MIKSQHSRSEFTLKLYEVERLWNSASNARDRTLIKCLYFLGLRRFEAAALRVGDLLLDRDCVVVEKGKGHKQRVIPIIDPGLASDLRFLIGSRKEGAVFLSNKGRPISIRQINHVVALAARKADLKHPNPLQKHINPHLLRHSLARHLKGLGVRGEAIQKILGHSSIKTTMDVYGTMSVDDVQVELSRKLGTRLPKHLEGQNQQTRRIE